PVVRITEEASRFAAENVMAEQKLRQTIRSRDEIGMLAESIDTMEERIHHYVEDLKVITAERERISTELSLAARIQNNMLPTIFPAFPERTEFDIYASMTPAKEVGGDFYDFFMVDRDHLCILIADVSGKGIPAALFMMASKIILKNNAMMGKSPATVLEHTNYAICASNEEEMFVTVWLGVLEISTGKLTAANAGHEYPALKTGDGKFELYKDKHGFVVGGLPGMKYKEYEIQMEKGSTIFVYTDGLSEASDEAEQMFGTDRILTALKNDSEASPEGLLSNMKASVAAFVKDAEQFDDLTMLALTYYGAGAPREEKKKEVNEEVSEENGEGEDPS
ncbi:MAG: PP2C family protein-serine/threonine phosphatase, partial [Lachnospiraceae bacterium]|nr:PP2C family protein-serine/threonine phosphatase [Lachnospiraceae bacterium]